MMQKFRRSIVLGFVLSSAVSGCSQTVPAIEGAGFSKGKPNAGTRNYIVQNDLPFAQWLAGHNRACERAPACQK